MKRRQDEDMMRQQDLIEKQKEQARYDSVSIGSLHERLGLWRLKRDVLRLQARQRSAGHAVGERQHEGRK